MQESLIAINLLNRKNKCLYNLTKHNEPILYYWNGEGNLYDKIINDKKFIELYLSNINLEKYLNLDICYFYFNNTFNKENYLSDKARLSDLILLEDNSKINLNSILDDLIDTKIKKLYNICCKTFYTKDIGINEKLNDIYNCIDNQYPNKFSRETYINWIRSDLVKDNNLNNDNINYIIKTVRNKLIENGNV